jgi:hypothetical protein
VLRPARADTVNPLTFGSRLVAGLLAVATSACRAAMPGFAALRPPPLVVRQSALSLVVTQNVTEVQETLPSSSDVSEVTCDHELPPSVVPTRPTVVPAPVAQQCKASGQLIEYIQPVSS